MTDDIQKYRAMTFQLAGFALMSPFGNLIIKAFELELLKMGLKLLIFILIYLLLFCGGIILITKGMSILEGKE